MVGQWGRWAAISEVTDMSNVWVIMVLHSEWLLVLPRVVVVTSPHTTESMLSSCGLSNTSQRQLGRPCGLWVPTVGTNPVCSVAHKVSRSRPLLPFLKMRMPNMAGGLCGKPPSVWFSCLWFFFFFLLGNSPPLVLSKALLELLQQCKWFLRFIFALGQRTVQLSPQGREWGVTSASHHHPTKTVTRVR